MTSTAVRAAVAVAAAAMAGCCSIPKYEPTYWNGDSTVRCSNNCYNYGNNKRTDNFAQPGHASGQVAAQMACKDVWDAAVRDGIDPLPASGKCPASSCSEQDKVALVVAPGHDYHWYRQGPDGMWTHKPGSTPATNLDSGGQPITDPATAARGPYTDFCGYMCSCSDAQQGQGHENIKGWRAPCSW
jgi:hypothetical protein